ncbi:hypothetical protein GF385_04480 [Candidatus Dependentiae bacterium]|nr:hypothetical protein [Candidatus Dependentiae bacterium]
MLLYETLILSNTHVTNDEFSMIEDFFDKFTSDVGGMVKSFDKWGKYRLAYPVRKNDYGIYSLVRFELPEDKASNFFKELDSFFKIKCNDIVFRNVTKRLDNTASLEYKKPEPVDARSGNLDTFLKENKMESFLGGNYSSKKKQAESASEKKESKETKQEEKKED